MPPVASGETTYSRDYRIGSAIKRLADKYPECSIITNHHVRKADSSDFVDTVSGTQGLAGARGHSRALAVWSATRRP